MKYTIDKSENVQGKLLKIGKYIRLADIGDDWNILPQSNRQHFFKNPKKVICHYTEYIQGIGHVQHNRLIETREHVHKIENRERRRFRLAKDADFEYILEICTPMNGVSWEKGIQYIRIYAQRPRARKSPKRSAPAFNDESTLTQKDWDDFLK